MLIDNQKNPERIANSKGQNLQNLENTKRRNKEIENELIAAEKKYSAINQNIKEIQSKLSELKENKARNEATLEGIENTTANRSFNSRKWSCFLWCDLCQLHRNPCITYLWVNHATPSIKIKVPITIPILNNTD